MLRSRFSNKTLRRVGLVILLAAPAWYMGKITMAKFEIGGASPNQRTLGAAAFVEQRGMEQMCTGVTVTPQSTWLIGSYEGSRDVVPGDTHPVSIDALLHDKATTDANGDEPTGSRGMRERTTSFLSRLNAQGQFELVATVSGTTCLQTTPDGRTLYLLTSQDRPASASGDGIQQTAVFRSDDQGKTWTWQRAGFMDTTNVSAWALKLSGFGAQELWSVGSGDGLVFGADAEADAGADNPAPDTGRAVALFYSNDGGKTAQRVPVPRSMLVNVDHVRGKAPSGVEWGSGAEAVEGEVQAQVVQLDAQRAVLWVSQRFRYSRPDSAYYAGAVLVTSRAELRRVDDHWQVGAHQRLEDTWVDAVYRNPAGRVIGLIDHAGDKRTQVALLDATTLAWNEQGSLPTSFDPLSASTYTRGFWAGQETLVANVSGTHHVPKWIYLWSADGAQISGDAVFYSRDWGRSWHRLAIPGYLGVAGFDAASDEVFWSKGNWYESSDKRVYGYGLR
ncbi:hypothetical protein K6V72_25840 [Ralstonia insidiosa]|uniref:Uncharacterized protein n=1 Tax=Ralstonia insidiosa TaxID=190721 RepID=A0A192A097_9RALS|nr:hypothetical protein [Ralstonia insidiosa]ANJ73758.1 hypothetical protein A9Y76_15390 [Ralstonia insidiosa]KAB0467714.1 hypothetical protein F7R11_25360 [Ralstonia insidiosa]MBY4912442.1 hypothetical protein [Ralstonia insidiosa]